MDTIGISLGTLSFLCCIDIITDDQTPISPLRKNIKSIGRIALTFGTCPTGWTHFLNSCYWFSESKDNWILAEGSCQSHNARLAEVYTKTHSDFLSMMSGNYGRDFWLGGRDDVIEGFWQWQSTDLEFNFTNWGPGEPNDSHGEDCLMIDNDDNNAWHDRECHDDYYYICEKRFDDGHGIIG